MKCRIVPFLMPVLCALIVSVSSRAFAEDAVIELSLRSCIDRALQENLNLRSATLGLRADYESVIQQRSAFDPYLNIVTSHGDSKTPNTVNYIPVSNTINKTSTVNFELSQKLFTGANWNVGIYSNLSDSNIQTNKNYSSYFGFNLTQPLLRNYGRSVAESGVYQALLTGKMSELDLRNSAESLIYSVESSYWTLVYARKTLDVLRMTVAQAESLLANNEMAHSLGLLTASDVLEAKSGVMARRRDVLDQENAVKSSEDALKNLLHLSTPEDLAKSVVPVDSIPVPEMEIDEGKLSDQALNMRPDYLAAQSAIEQSRIEAAVSKNALLPGLDLNTSYRRNGSGTSLSRNFDMVGEGSAYGWEVGLNFVYPLGNRAAKSAFEKSTIQYNRSTLAKEDLEQSILTDLRAAIRNVRVNRRKIDEMALEVEVNRQKLDQEQERFQNHLSTSYLVLTYQNDLANILNLYNKTLVDYNLSVVKLQQTTGTLLRDLNITIRGRTP